MSESETIVNPVMTANPEPVFGDSVPDYGQYRVLSVMAVAALMLAIVSIPVLFFVQLVFLPILGVIIGLRAIQSIRRSPHELTGMKMAVAGTLLSLGLAIGSMGWAVYVYNTEVPEGFERIAWHELQPDASRPDLPVSPRSLEYDGKKVFVKGYIYPDESGGELKKFVLVPDMGTCCFGGQPALTDMIEVTLTGDQRTRYSIRKQRLAGILQVDTKKKPVSGLDGVYYQLTAEYIR